MLDPDKLIGIIRQIGASADFIFLIPTRTLVAVKGSPMLMNLPHSSQKNVSIIQSFNFNREVIESIHCISYS